MPTVYVDVHLGTSLIGALRQHMDARGFHEVDQDASDPVHLRHAAEKQWTILTRDEDFRQLHEQWYCTQAWRPLVPPQQHAGIIWVESGARTLPDDRLAEAVIEFLAAEPPPPLADVLYVLYRSGSGPAWDRYNPYRKRRRVRVR